MAYIGAQPNKTLTETTSQSFNGTGSATAFTLNRAVNTGEELEVFVDNVQQEPGSGKSYTATGTTLTFDEAPPSGTGNVYVIYRGQAEVTTRLEAPDLSITTAKLAADAVTTAKITDANVTEAKMFSGFANGITELDIWYKTANETISGSSSAAFSSNLARWATNWEKIGTGMTESSGVFTFPSTGKWQVHGEWSAYSTGNADYMGMFINISTDSGSNYTTRTNAYANAKGNGAYFHLTHTAFFDVTNASTFRLFFSYQTHTGAVIRGGADSLKTHFSFIKIADT